MSPRRRSDIDRELEELYAQIPDIDCKGRCHTSCGPIRMSDRERSRIKETYKVTIRNSSGYDYPPQRVPSCPALTEDKRCSVYDLRPLICRLWGAVEGMPCTYGCRPKNGGRLLSDEDAYKLIAEAQRIGGGNLGGLSGEEVQARLKQLERLRPALRSMVADATEAEQVRASGRKGTFGSGRP